MSQAKRTALYDWHLAQGARMVDFAGYAMPVQYGSGIVKEHQWTRAHAGLFDVSHMGQIRIAGEDVAGQLETLMPMDFQALALGQLRYSLLLNAQATIEDDLMVTRRAEDWYLVVNASRKEEDMARLQTAFAAGACRWWQGRSLLALQGPEAVAILSEINPQVAELKFMRAAEVELLGEMCWVSRSGYTGEDGFEISLPDTLAVRFAEKLCADARVQPIGLGARDSLRLEAGLCLYGQDIDDTTTPIEAGLGWAIQKSRRPDGERAGGYPGAEILTRQYGEGAARVRVGLQVDGRLPVRAHTALLDADGYEIGQVSSGGFAPSLNAPVAMGYVSQAQAAVGNTLWAEVRGKRVALTVVTLPFVKKDYKK